MRVWVWAAALCGLALAAMAVEPVETELRRVVPGADRLEPVPGSPPYWRAFRGDELLGFALSTGQAVGSVGYSGKPLDILVGIDRTGIITGALVLEQHEPILATGATAADIDAFVAALAGRSIAEPIVVLRRGADAGEIDAVAGATVSSSVIADAVLVASRAVARAAGLLDGAVIDLAIFAPASWDDLLADGSLVRRQIDGAELTAELAALGAIPTLTAEPEATVAELFVGLASVARVGRNLLGEIRFARETAQLRTGDMLLFVGGRGLYSFRGTEWRRSGMLERIQIAQDDRTWRPTAADHVQIDTLAIAGAPALRELSLLVMRADSGFRAERPWRLQLLLPGRDVEGRRVTAVAELLYELPERYRRIVEPERPLWERMWRARAGDVAVLLGALVVLSAIFFGQEWLVAEPRRLRVVRLGFLSFTLAWLGWYTTAQLSVVNVLTFIDALRAGFRWEPFLVEPLIFILWAGVAAGLVLWGRGPFCGWLCPFGALQELTNQAGRRLGMPQLTVPWWLHERLRSLKFLIFLGMFAVSLGSVGLAHQLAEIEPFKTAIVLRFWREPWFIAWAILLLGVGLVVERAFCRYLCPLGAALALPARLRQFEWLKRRRQCGVECRICAVQCPVGAIQPEGPIHPGECIYCLHCQANYGNARVCPPLIERRKRAERRKALIRAGTASQ